MLGSVIQAHVAKLLKDWLLDVLFLPLFRPVRDKKKEDPAPKVIAAFKSEGFGRDCSVCSFSGLHLDNVASPDSREVNKVYTRALALYKLNIRNSV